MTGRAGRILRAGGWVGNRTVSGKKSHRRIVKRIEHMARHPRIVAQESSATPMSTSNAPIEPAEITRALERLKGK